jgi:diguanylate cyclase (GGDEF)-like protein
MSSLVTRSIRRNAGILALVLTVLVSGIWMIVQVTTDRLLNQNATAAAYSWARYLASNVFDLEQIAGGEQPSSASMGFFSSTRRSAQVFRYMIFNRQGYSQLVSDHNKMALVDFSEFSVEAARAVTTGQPVVGTKEGAGAEQPAYFAEAYIPVVVDGRVIAVVAAYVDQSEQRDNFYDTSLIAAAALCALISFAFAVPTVAWYRRTKEKQHADRHIRFLAHHDALTGLPNRAQLFELLEGALKSVRPGSGLAVHFVDLDRFKEVNDTFGHDGGDFLLKTIADRMRAAVREDDVIARLGGDEFVVVQADVSDRRTVETFAAHLTAALTLPMPFKDDQILASVSVGAAIAPADGLTPDRLLKSADLALYKAKADGRNCVRFFNSHMDAAVHARLELERTIRDAVLRDGFELHYQPLFEVTGRRLVGYEALIRLPKADGTLIPPMVFIPVAEEMRLIDQIGEWVLREACRFAATWPQHLTVAVNLSPVQFSTGNISEIVTAALESSGLAARQLELEITETLLLGDSKAVMAQLTALKAMGVAIVMDDFGTGYSSLSYLWRFPFDKIKIDRSFMQGLAESARDAETVMKTIIALGRELHMRVTVEGIENAKQVEFLVQANSDQAQGFYFGRPVPAAEVVANIMADLKNFADAETDGGDVPRKRSIPG